jgi:TrpR-related protein YerC/YecD
VFHWKKGEKIVSIEKLKNEEFNQLFEAILSLESVEECYKFFDDICTISEIQSISQRLQVAKMLNTGLTYNKIETETGASTATISRVKRCLNYGNEGYKIALDRISPKQEEENL